MKKKIRVGVLFGGRSCEHEVSVASARSIVQAIDREHYDVRLIGIDREGRWVTLGDDPEALSTDENSELQPVLIDYPGNGDLLFRQPTATSPDTLSLDVVFPILHGPYGEDGTVQGLLELAGLAYVGAGVLGSAVGMDKALAKHVFAAHNLPQLDWKLIRRWRWRREPSVVLGEIQSQFSYPLFVKPANLGSSVGVGKAHDEDQLRHALDKASELDRRIVVEAQASDCREIECAVMGNDHPQPSVLGEVVPCNEFYDYEAKYVIGDSNLIIPANLSNTATSRLRDMAVSAFVAVESQGLARVDFFVSRSDETIYLNEINTMPGFTPISMYPKLWEASGVSYSELIDRLIQLAMDRHTERRDIRTTL